MAPTRLCVLNTSASLEEGRYETAKLLRKYSQLHNRYFGSTKSLSRLQSVSPILKSLSSYISLNIFCSFFFKTFISVK